MKTLVIGGTGTVGSEVVRGLVSRKESVRVMTRSAEKIRTLPAGAEGMVADLRDPAGLKKLLQGIDGVFLVTALSQDETEQGLAAVDAAQKAGVRRIVYLSVHKVDSAPHIPHFKTKLPVQEAIVASGLAYAILQPNNFFQNDFWFRDAITKHGVYPQPIGSVGLHRVDVRDIADAAVNALTNLQVSNGFYPLVGPESLTGEQVAAAFSRKLGREVGYAGDDLDAWAAQARATLPGWLVHDFRIMYKHFQKHGLLASKEDFTQQAKILGHTPRNFEAFVAEVAPIWKNASIA